MPMSATACRTSSTLKGLMTAVISFMHGSALSPVNQTAPQRRFRVVLTWNIAVSVPATDGRRIKELRDGGPRRRTEVARRRLHRALPRCDRNTRAGLICGGFVGGFRFMNSNALDDLARRLADSVPESLRAFG